MNEQNQLELFSSGKVSTAVLKNAIPAMVAMLMVPVYNLADTFFIGQTHDDLQVAAVAMCTPVFLMFMSAGTVFGPGVLRRCKKLGAIQKSFKFLFKLCLCHQYCDDKCMLFAYRANR